jgi:putative restriction endonuclease
VKPHAARPYHSKNSIHIVRISEFFSGTLQAPLRNTRWSWGSVNSSGTVFLRIWDDEFGKRRGRTFVLVLEPDWRRSGGFRERERHIEMIKEGAPAYGVICTALDPDSDGPRSIKSYDTQNLAELGEVIVEGGAVYVEVRGQVGTTAASRSIPSPASDIEAVIATARHSTERRALIDARLGQGEFRSQVLELWDGRCALTGSSALAAIRASHIKPWRCSTNHERLDPANGLPLLAHLDALFDAGLITFDLEGAVIVSHNLSATERRIFRLKDCRLRRKPHSLAERYLNFHRGQVFVDR